MRNSTIVGTILVTTLIVGLVGAVSMADASNTASIGLSSSSSLRLNVTKGSSITLPSFDPLNDQTWNSGSNYSTVQVKSNTDWYLTTSKSVGSEDANANTGTVDTHFTVDPQINTGSSNTQAAGTNNIDVYYKWSKISNPGDLPGGTSYTVTVTFTASAA